jgi:glycerol-3-phosphate acyltransferase PlsX
VSDASTLPTRPVIAVDAMGGDHAPKEIVAGALTAAATSDIRVLLFGREEDVMEHVPDGRLPERVEVHDAREVVEMEEEPAASVRRKKDASIVRCAQAVRDGEADAMVSAGNTGAAMAAALLRMGRIPGVARPAIAVPIPVPYSDHPQVLVDAGATVDVTPEWLLQFARMGRAYARCRYGIDEPTIGLLSNGEEAGKGDSLRKGAHDLLVKEAGFVGNVEGRDFMHAGKADVIVADGFTGNIALKSIEGALRALGLMVFTVLDSTEEAKEAAKVVLPLFLEAATIFDPDLTGGAVLLGVKGACVISHGSSSAKAMVSAIEVARDCVVTGLVDQVRGAIADAG